MGNTDRRCDFRWVISCKRRASEIIAGCVMIYTEYSDAFLFRMEHEYFFLNCVEKMLNLPTFVPIAERST